MRKFLLIILLAVFYSCADCKHFTMGLNPHEHRIDHTVGMAAMEEYCTGYVLKDNCIIMTKAEICYNCGGVIGTFNQTLCGDFHIIY